MTSTLAAPGGTTAADEAFVRAWYETARKFPGVPGESMPEWDQVSSTEKRRIRRLVAATASNGAAPSASAEPLDLGAKPRTGGCAVATILSKIEDPATRGAFAALVDGTDSNEFSPFQVQKVAESQGLRLTASIVRHHRRRITQNGEHCSCPR